MPSGCIKSSSFGTFAKQIERSTPTAHMNCTVLLSARRPKMSDNVKNDVYSCLQRHGNSPLSRESAGIEKVLPLSLVNPISFNKFFGLTDCGGRVLLRVIEFCDAITVRRLASLFPWAVRRPLKQDKTPTKKRRALVTTTNAVPTVVSSARTRRRVFVGEAPVPQKLIRANTVFGRYLSVKPDYPEKSQQQQQQNVCEKKTDRLRGVSPIRTGAFSRQLVKNNVGNARFALNPLMSGKPMEMEASEVNELSATMLKPAADDCVDNKFVRIERNANEIALSEALNLNEGLALALSSQSVERSESPPPRFPSFSQYLDEKDSAPLLQQHYKENSHGFFDKSGQSDALKKSIGRVVKELEVVELASCERAVSSPLVNSPVPDTPHATNNVKQKDPHGSDRKKNFYNSPPQLGSRSKTVFFPVSEQRIAVASTSFSCATSRATANMSLTFNGMKVGLNKSKTKMNSNSVTSLALQTRLNSYSSSGKNGGVNSSDTGKIYTLRSAVVQASHQVKQVAPQPFASSLSTLSSRFANTSQLLPTARRGSRLYCPVKRTAQGFTTENDAKTKKMIVASPRFERRSTLHTTLVGRNGPPLTTRAPLASRAETKPGQTTFFTARPTKVKEQGTFRSAAQSGALRSGESPTVDRHKNSVQYARSVTSRRGGTQMQLQRIESSRFLPTCDGTRRYVPPQTDAQLLGQQTLPSPPLMVLHITRKPKSSVAKLSGELQKAADTLPAKGDGNGAKQQ